MYIYACIYKYVHLYIHILAPAAIDLDKPAPSMHFLALPFAGIPPAIGPRELPKVSTPSSRSLVHRLLQTRRNQCNKYRSRSLCSNVLFS